MAGQQSKKSRKHDRNRNWCKAYRASGREFVNQCREWARHLKRNPNDGKIRERLKAILFIYGKRAGVPGDFLETHPRLTKAEGRS